MAHRRRRGPAFRQTKLDGIYDPHVAPINKLVDRLRNLRGWLPYVTPIYGGVNAKALFVLRDPERKTNSERARRLRLSLL